MCKEVLDGLCRTAEAIATMLGRSCETVVHDFTNNQCKIVAIYNSHVSGRDMRSTETIYGMAINDVKEFTPVTEYVNTMVNTKDGKAVKTSSINFVGEGYHYVLGINLDTTALSAARGILGDMLQTEEAFDKSPLADRKLADSVDYCISIVGKEAGKLTKADRMRIVSMLHDNNIFSIQRAVPYVSDRLGISRYTVYNYLNELKG